MHVYVYDDDDNVIFVGKPAQPDEFVTIDEREGKVAKLTCNVSALAAGILSVVK